MKNNINNKVTIYHNWGEGLQLNPLLIPKEILLVNLVLSFLNLNIRYSIYQVIIQLLNVKEKKQATFLTNIKYIVEYKFILYTEFK